MTNINDILDEIERYIKEYMNSPEPDFITKNFHIPHKPITRLGDLEKLKINKVIFSDPCTIILWSDGTKTIVRTQGDDIYDPEKGMAMAICKKYIGGSGNYYDEFKKWLPKEKVDDFKDYSLKSLAESMKEAIDDMTKSVLARNSRGIF